MRFFFGADVRSILMVLLRISQRYHQVGGPPIPKNFSDIAHAIRNLGPGECCHAVMPQDTLDPEARSAGGVRPPPGAMPPSANAGEVRWRSTGGRFPLHVGSLHTGGR